MGMYQYQEHGKGSWRLVSWAPETIQTADEDAREGVSSIPEVLFCLHKGCQSGASLTSALLAMWH